MRYTPWKKTEANSRVFGLVLEGGYGLRCREFVSPTLGRRGEDLYALRADLLGIAYGLVYAACRGNVGSNLHMPSSPMILGARDSTGPGSSGERPAQWRSSAPGC